MKFLCYTWNDNSSEDLCEGLENLGHTVVKVSIPLKNYDNDDEFTQMLEQKVTSTKCDAIISFDYFPIITKTAEKFKILYYSWVYDMPHTTVFSQTVKSDYVKLFLFDKSLYMKVSEIKPKNIYHLPLAVNVTRLNKQLGVLDENVTYSHDVSFVGSLYENSMFRQIKYLPEYVKGYIDGLINVQKKLYGYNIINESLSPKVIAELEQYVKLGLSDSYLVSSKELYANIIEKEITAQERQELLSVVSDYFSFDLYTNSDRSLIPNANYKGTVKYRTEMPTAFRTSKINLNITLRSIESGIPLRAIDIMGAGGFLLSNYQNELCELFEEGTEMICFESKEDLIQKIDYFLQNDTARKTIAKKGYEKVAREYSYEKQLNAILNNE